LYDMMMMVVRQLPAYVRQRGRAASRAQTSRCWRIAPYPRTHYSSVKPTCGTHVMTEAK
jgi:hypothetical protein